MALARAGRRLPVPAAGALRRGDARAPPAAGDHRDPPDEPAHRPRRDRLHPQAARRDRGARRRHRARLRGRRRGVRARRGVGRGRGARGRRPGRRPRRGAADGARAAPPRGPLAAAQPGVAAGRRRDGRRVRRRRRDDRWAAAAAAARRGARDLRRAHEGLDRPWRARGARPPRRGPRAARGRARRRRRRQHDRHADRAGRRGPRAARRAAVAGLAARDRHGPRARQPLGGPGAHVAARRPLRGAPRAHRAGAALGRRGRPRAARGGLARRPRRRRRALPRAAGRRARRGRPRPGRPGRCGARGRGAGGRRHRPRSATILTSTSGIYARVLPFLLTVPWLAWAVVRLGGLERSYLLVATMAFTPYAAATAWIPVVVAVVLRRRLMALFALVPAVALTPVVAPRALGGPQDAVAGGQPVSVMTANLRRGAADPRALMALVRTHRVELLSPQE